MPSDWGYSESQTDALTHLANIVDESASSTADDEEIRVTQDVTDPGNISRYATQFNDLATVERQQYININSSQGLSVLRDVQDMQNGGHAEAHPSTGEIHLSTGAQTDSYSSLETARWGQYTPGYIGEVGMGARLPQQPTGDAEIKWGYFDDKDGFYFGYDSTGLFVAFLRNGSEERRVYRDNWNGREPNDVDGVNFQPSDGAIFQINYAWYGYGAIQFSIISSQTDEPQTNVVVHTFATEGQTSITNPNQPIQARIDNNTTSTSIDAYIGGRQYSILGKVTDQFRISSQTVTDVAVDNGAWTHVASIRRKTTDDRRVNLLIDGIETNAGDDVRFALVVNANIGSTAYGPYDLIPASETISEFSSAGTFNGIGSGTKAFETFVPVDQNQKSAVGDPIRDLNQPIPRNYPLSVIAQGVGVSSTVDATLRVREQW